MTMQFKKAVKSQLKLRQALLGPAGSGKTYTALRIATAIAKAEGKRIALLDTERESASLYADIFDFDAITLDSYEPQRYIEAIKAAEAAGYGVLVIDSLTHAWNAKGGILEQKDNATKRQKTPNDYTAWRDVTPLHNELVDTMLAAKLHLIVTMRVKMEYVQEKDEKTGKTTVRKIGLQPVQRDGLEYEFTIIADLDQENNFIVGKSRCPLVKGWVEREAGEKYASTVLGWLNNGAPEVFATEEQRQQLVDFSLVEWKDARVPARIQALLGNPRLLETEAADAIAKLTQLSTKDAA